MVELQQEEIKALREKNLRQEEENLRQREEMRRQGEVAGRGRDAAGEEMRSRKNAIKKNSLRLQKLLAQQNS